MLINDLQVDPSVGTVVCFYHILRSPRAAQTVTLAYNLGLTLF